MSDNSLNDRFEELRRRLLAVGLGTSAGWGLAGALLLLLAMMWMDLALDFPPAARLTGSVVAAGIGLTIVGRLAALWRRQGLPRAMARRLDQIAGARGQILSGFELMPAVAGVTNSSGITAGLAHLAVERAATIAATVPPPAAAPVRPLYRSLTALGGIGGVVLLLASAAPRLAATEWSRFADPFGDHPPYSSIQFTVTPGDASVIYGSSLDIRAATGMDPVENAEVVMVAADGTGRESLPMFPEESSKWRATVANITAPAKYFIRSGNVRSRTFSINVIMTPRLESVRFRITPPPYTHRPAMDGPLPSGGIAALPGTLVEVWAKSNRPLARGDITAEPLQGYIPAYSANAPPATYPSLVSSFSMNPVAGSPSEVTGSFVVRQPGRVSLNVSDVNGQTSAEKYSVSITLLRDERPFVRILQPQAESFATPEVTLDVQILAEDDYGVSRVELFRGLNESRVRSMAVPVPQPQPTRLPVSVPLPLSAYALSPGDVVKLFARVEDNDPAGAKGSESPLVTVRIISKEQMQQMLLAREGLETLLSKYEQASRRMEAASDRLDKLIKELEKSDSNSELSGKMRQQLEDAATQFAADTDALAKLATESLPFDLDHALNKQLDTAKEALSDAANTARGLASRPGVSAAGAARELAEARKKLGDRRGQFKEEASDPLDHLAKVYPLIEDQARFLELWQRQADLAGRMDALSGHDGDDDPHLKSRMRDLENEQRQRRDDLRQLLDNIENHTAELPPDKRLDELRQTARTFAAAVRASNASDQMAAAESGLAEFAGTRAHIAARTAAQTLEKFIGQCNSVSGQAKEGLKFQPTLSSSIGNTVQELLDAAGLGQGSKFGQGGSGGYSARRNSLRNVGLYGQIPRRGEQAGPQSGRAMKGQSSDGTGISGDPGDSAAGAAARSRSSGQSEAAIPTRYQRRVGEYFQRVADELEQKP